MTFSYWTGWIRGLVPCLLLGCLSCAPGGPHGSNSDSGPTSEAATLLRRAIRIPTVNPPGDERPLAELYADVLEQAGLETRVIETPAGASSVGRAAAWARYRGSGSQRPIILLSHLDVVSADRANWAVDPFSGAAVGGYVVGRGALDAKGVGVIHLRTMLELARRQVRLDRDVIFLATPDEESGGRSGAGYLVSERPELLGQAEFLLTEGGGIREGPGDNIWGVGVSEKVPCWIRVTARGAPGHSSTARPDAATHRLVAALGRIQRMDSRVVVIPEVARMFAALSPLAPEADRVGYADLSRALEFDPEFRQRFLSHPSRNALVRNTVAITVLEGGPRTNVLPAQATAELDARLLPPANCPRVVSRIAAHVGDPAVRLETILSFSGRSSPMDTKLFRAIREVAGKLDPGSHVIPRVIAGFTDAHYFRDVGIVSYGFVPRWLSPHETRGVHGRNERISVENLDRGVEAMLEILTTLAGE